MGINHGQTPHHRRYPDKRMQVDVKMVKVTLFIGVLFTISMIWKWPTCPLIDEENVVIHIYNGILLDHKKWYLTICDIVEGPKAYFTQWNKSVKERQLPYVLTYMWNLKNKINKQNWNRLIDTENKNGGGLSYWMKEVKGLRGTNW